MSGTAFTPGKEIRMPVQAACRLLLLPARCVGIWHDAHETSRAEKRESCESAETGVTFRIMKSSVLLLLSWRKSVLSFYQAQRL